MDISRADQPHLAVVKVPDDRLVWLAEQYKPKKFTPAELEFLDLPGFDLRDESGRSRAKTHWAAMRQSDMLVFVVRDFVDVSVPEYRDRVNYQDDAAELMAEMLFADFDQVTNRIEKLEAAVKKPTAQREANKRELEVMRSLSEALDANKPITSVIQSPAEGKLLRSFAFLSQKPVLVVINRGEDDAGQTEPVEVGSLEGLGLSAKLEQELAELQADERAEFLADLGLAAPARDRLIRACYQSLKLASFFTVGDDECRAWTVPADTEAVVAAEEIHSDIARGFIRAETVAYDDYRSAGDMKGAKAAGKVRLEGKTYPVRDGDIINFRFNV